MKSKPHDVLYDGVNQERIKVAKPTLNQESMKLLKEFIHDRYEIHLKKDVEKLPAPWTANSILQQVKFTNVRREHDRQSQNYINLIASRDISWFGKFWNTVMFRMFNVASLWEYVYPEAVSIHTLPSELGVYYQKFKELEYLGKPLFTNAFNTGGLKQSLALPEYDHVTCRAQRRDEMIIKGEDGSDINYKLERERLLSGELKSPDFEPYMPMRVIRYVAKAANVLLPTLHADILKAGSQQEAYEMLLQIRGFSRFLAYQVFVDLTYCPEFQFSENEFTVSGPGCDAGVKLWFDGTDGMTPEECLFWLRDNADEVFGKKFFYDLFSDLPEHDRCVNVQNLENVACEFSKYHRCNQQISEGKKPRGKVSTERLVSNTKSPTAPVTKKLW